MAAVRDLDVRPVTERHFVHIKEIRGTPEAYGSSLQARSGTSERPTHTTLPRLGSRKTMRTMSHQARAIRLAEVIAHCDSVPPPSDPLSSLRSPALRPDGMLHVRHWRTQLPEPQWDDWMDQIAETRADNLRARGAYPSIVKGGLAGGRVMLYFPDEQLADGASAEASGGYFDLENAPPWDTWMWIEDALLHAQAWFTWWIATYVPPALVDRAERGRKVNPERCLQWADFGEGLMLIPRPE